MDLFIGCSVMIVKGMHKGHRANVSYLKRDEDAGVPKIGDPIIDVAAWYIDKGQTIHTGLMPIEHVERQ